MTDPAGRLLVHLRETLGVPGVRFAEPPVPLGGGFDTRIYAFQLAGAPPELSGPLVLRVVRRRHGAVRVRRERAAHAALVELGYPVPRVLLSSTDPDQLGAPFLLMERLAGRPLLEAQLINLGGTLAAMQARLHALDPAPFLRAFEREGLFVAHPEAGPAAPLVATLDGHLALLRQQIEGAGLDGLRSALAWLCERRPPEGPERVICHGDFHPMNILKAGATVTGVVDWPNALVADPALDVASTKAIVSLAETPKSRLLVRFAGLARPLLVARYLRAYQRLRRLDAGGLPYYEALACMRMLIRAGEERVLSPEPGHPLEAPLPMPRVAARFRALTGIMPVLPGPAPAALGAS